MVPTVAPTDCGGADRTDAGARAPPVAGAWAGGAPQSSTNGMPSTVPARKPSHMCHMVPAGTPAVRNASASTGIQKNLPGQRGPRRSAIRACMPTNSAATSGTITSSRPDTSSRAGWSKPNESATLPAPR